MKNRVKDNKWLFVYIILNIMCVIYGLLYAQAQNDWDATEILSEMDKSWSIGNGCLEGHHKVVDVYDGLELNGNTLEIMDATIQVIGGSVTNFGIEVNTDDDLIIYSCESSNLVVYEDVLDTPEVSEVKVEIKVYPNPITDAINIKADDIDYFILYNINGQEVLRGRDKTTYVGFLDAGLYIMNVYYRNTVSTFKLIKYK